jgi:hypothetical protein
MGKILPNYKKALIDELITSISANDSHYYAFGANPVEYPGDVPVVTDDDYSSNFINNWQLLFGKKITAGDVVPVIRKETWTSNSVYNRYDNTSNTLFTNNNFYVVSNPAVTGASFHVYKCIDNANNGYSTVDPGTIGTPTQVSTFQTSDGYKWRYMYSITEYNSERFSSEDYIPVYTNGTLSSTASSYSGVEVVMITNTGSGYTAYSNGIIRSVQNSTVVQIENDASGSDNFYVNNGIYVYNTIEATSQLRVISDYVSNSSGKFVYVSSPLETDKITSGITQYLISPAVVFDTDGDADPKAYSVVNTSNYSISNVVILDIGTNISWANVKIQSSYGSGANVYAIVPPPGGHGFDPATELDVKGLAISFRFANSELATIPTANILYNKIGIFKNPYSLEVDEVNATVSKGTAYTANTFDQLLKANVSPSYTFTTGEVVTGANSGARGIVVFSNTTQVYISGDKYFIDGEYLANSIGTSVTTITINEYGDIYSKDIRPIYVDNINNVNRSNTQTEVYKLTIEI